MCKITTTRHCPFKKKNADSIIQNINNMLPKADVENVEVFYVGEDKQNLSHLTVKPCKSAQTFPTLIELFLFKVCQHSSAKTMF